MARRHRRPLFGLVALGITLLIVPGLVLAADEVVVISGFKFGSPVGHGPGRRHGDVAEQRLDRAHGHRG